MTPEAAFQDALARHGPDGPGARIGVAVSGGGDSTALLLLALDWARRAGSELRVATVDHGLRATSAEEALAVAGLCARHGLAHDTLRWAGWDGTGNLQAAARAARRSLLGQWAADHDIGAVLLGHTADDRVETFVMRLARGSGVDGLSAMARARDGIFVRPLLEVRRSDLRRYLEHRDTSWIEDPSNDDPRFDRIKVRQLLPHLEALGLSPDRIAQTVAHMDRARSSLWCRAVDFGARHVRAEGGDLILDVDALCLGRTDTEGRVFAAAIQWLGRAAYRPRHDAVLAAGAALRRGESRTLGGVMMVAHDHGARLSREPAACPVPRRVEAGAAVVTWDGRWQLTPPRQGGRPGKAPPGLRVGALGEYLAMIDGWRGTGMPRSSLMASPAIFGDQGLVAAPLAGAAHGWSVRLSPDFPAFLRGNTPESGAVRSHRADSR